MTSKKEQKYNLVRPPVVTVLGHVDHGKTSLLDCIRGTRVQKCEAGGITQNTRAHEIEFKGQKITFIDTPGHEAFSGMRSRGAKITDIVLLVVAADDGVKPQTKESIKFAQSAKVPIIVAINKVDLPNIDFNKIKSELSQNNILIEDYGGDVQLFKVSASKNKGIEELLDGILIQAEMLELKKGKSKYAASEAVVLESKLDKNLGPISLVLVKTGEINVGDTVVFKGNRSQVRALLNECQGNIEKAYESSPVWVLGLKEAIPSGEVIYFTSDEKTAQEIVDDQEPKKVEIAESKEEDKHEENTEADDLDALAQLLAEEQKSEDIKKLNVVVKTDTEGTLEVVFTELKKLNTDEVEINVLSKGTGEITRKDVLTAKNAHGIVIGFQVKIPSELHRIISQEKVLVRVYDVIYDLVDEVSDALDGMLEPLETEEEIARAKVKKVFSMSDGSLVAGSLIVSGNVIKGYKVWVEREGEEVGRGKIKSLRQLKNEVKEVGKGSECGILVEPRIEILEGDQIVLYKVVKN